MSILVAGVGNIFLGDDGFGVEVARRLQSVELPPDVKVADFGIRGVHLAYELLDGYELVILVDATPRGGTPGDLYVIEPEPDEPDPDEVPPLDAHGMDPGAVLNLLGVLGGRVDRMLVVGCEPAVADEGMTLSPAVAAAVDPAVALVQDLINEHRVPLGGRSKEA
jgi:hydrogenase maturation protease